jgi:hypothetical protein
MNYCSAKIEPDFQPGAVIPAYAFVTLFIKVRRPTPLHVPKVEA